MLRTALPQLPFYCKGKKGKVLNVPCSFDIETTSTYLNGEKAGVMYIWMLGINGATMVGRTWPEFVDTLQQISGILQLNKEKRMVVYIRNFSFEFQFMRKWFEWDSVFAVNQRTPAYGITTNGFEFRCSYLLSGYSLEKTGELLRKYPVKKLVGNLDYTLLRNSQTVLTDAEMDYCLNDIKVDMAYIQEMIEKDGSVASILLTKTGYVRKYCRNSCLYMAGSHKQNGYKYIRYRKLMNALSMTLDEYKQCKRAFQGGFTHASCWHSGDVCYNIHSYDFTSSYPAVMIAEKFPMSAAEIIEVKDKQTFDYNLERYCCIFDIELTGLRSHENAPDHYLSKSKCWRLWGRFVEDNGRIITAEHLCTTITDVDWAIIKQFYTFENVKIGTFRRYHRGYLPTDFVKAILQLYQDKTQLKNVPEREEEYMNSKEMLNSCYGMTVTDIISDEQVYDGEWHTEPADYEKAIEKYNNDKRRFLFYLWGIFVTAYARRNLWTGIKELGEDDYIYSDTDSVKFMNLDKHRQYFDNYNTWIRKRLEKACRHHRIEISSIAPKTVKGVEKVLGVWDYEGMYSRFKTLGAKRYMTEKDSAVSITVSGVNKKYAVPYIVKKFKDPFEGFEDDLRIPKEHTGKMTHTYIDDELHGVLRDFQGHSEEIYEKSCIHLEQCEFTLSLSAAYLDLLMGFKEINK